MPAHTAKQRRFFGAELGRLRRGEDTETDLSEHETRKFARRTPGRKRRVRRQRRLKARAHRSP